MEEKKALSRAIDLVKLGSDLEKGSNYLTEQIRSYVQFGNRVHFENFLREVNITKSREKVISSLKKLGVAEEDLKILKKAKQYSDNLIKTEKAAMDAVEKKKFQKARELVFGDYYREHKSQIVSQIHKFQNSINQKARIEISDARQKASIYWLISIFLLVVCGFFVFWAIYFIAIRKLVNPLKHLSETIRPNKKSTPSLEVPFLTRNDEIGDLANSVKNFKEDLIEKINIEKKLDDSEDQFRSLVNNIPGASYRCLLDEHYTMLYMSDNIRDLAGYPPGDFIKNSIRTFDSIIHPEDKEKVKGVIENSVAKKVQYTVEYRIFHSNGKELWVREKGQASFDEKGGVQHLNGAIFDITDSRNAETKLRHSEQMTRAIIENALECIIRINEKGIIQSFNPAAEKTFGYKTDEVINQNIKILLPEPHRSEHDGYLKKYLETGVNNIIGFARELEAIRKDGSVFPIELSVSEIFLGEERFFNGMIRDITRRKEIEKNLQRANKQSDFALGLTKAGYWHVPLDDSGYYNSSEKAAAIFGDPPRPDHRYKIIDEWYANVEAADKEAAEATMENFKGAIEGRYPLYDSTYAYKRPVDEKIVWIHALAYVVRDENGKAVEMYGVTQDITESKLLEEKLREASVKAEQANKAKSLFISSMSHEIRTPMNAILGYSQILERDKGLTEKQRKGLESIHRAGKHLLGIINDILDFSKIEAGKLELHPHDFDLGSLVQDLVFIFSGKCKEKKLELKTEGVQEGQKIHVHAEAGKLRQVLVNLIGNGVKFTDSGSVCLRVMPLAGEQFYFEVKDTGQGIPPEKLKTIFDSFQQDEVGIKKGGTGLGLAIAKSIVSAMGGELQVESEVNKGSRFFFTLDLPSAKESVRDKDDSLARVTGLAPGQSVKAVLIDDNKDNLEVLAATLQEVGIETVEAENGPDGLELISKLDPDILFVDYHMPKMDGLEVIKRVREEYGEEKIKIVMISASTFAHHREQYMKEGVHGFVGKPFLREEILGVMARLLGLDYEYEEGILAEKVPEEKDLDFSSLKIPKELHKSATEMASMGMMTELEELLPQIESSCSEGPHLSAHIKNLIDHFDTDGIVEVLEKVGNE